MVRLFYHIVNDIKMIPQSQYYERAKNIAEKSGFKINQKIYSSTYYGKKIRNIIYSGIYKNKPAVLKIYDDERINDEPISLKAFNKVNKSKALLTPALYEYRLTSPTQGWLIIEKLPPGGYFFSEPLKDHLERKKFLELFKEYRINFPKKPMRQMRLSEQLTADRLHLKNIYKWFNLADRAEYQRLLKKQDRLLNPKSFMPLFNKALDKTKKEFINRKLVWCHGHFKPHEIYHDLKNNAYFLIDFAHTKYYPEGYELAFIIWAEHLMSYPKQCSYRDWRKRIDEWIKDLRPLAKISGIKNYDTLIRAALLERVLGTILADTVGSNLPRKKSLLALEKLLRLLEELI